MPAEIPARVLTLAGSSVQVFADAPTACLAAAGRIAEAVKASLAARGRAVLGLATGATPEPVYARLVALHREGALSFARVSTYNLDEYYPIQPLDPLSYRSYMHWHLFQHVDLAPDHAHVLDGTVPEAFAAEHAAQFDRWIAADGGLDLQLLGIGRNGHIGFNEPSDLSVDDARKLPTRLVPLHPITRTDAAREFGGEDKVIPRALTMGVAPILAARSILVLAFGPRKAEVVAEALRGPVTAEVPASLLQTVPGKVTWLLDEAAAHQLVYDSNLR
ncbi:MAG: glucosamine-6-phosphate deaminase [Isosphaeraceae bacterium]|nr:glucosamine-6-phosphate deaminase [Isosphaeraceae bacterium]